MQFEHELIGRTLVFHVHNLLLDAHGADQFKRQMLIALNEGEFTNIIINLNSVKMVDSSGLGALLFARRQVVQKDGECYLINPSPKVKNLLKISKLQDAFAYSEQVEEALEKLGESSDEPGEEEDEPSDAANNGESAGEVESAEEENSTSSNDSEK